ncbi:MAG: right-handed parallel beta-helix repeat-containing protein [Chthoniobacterales bacterium]
MKTKLHLSPSGDDRGDGSLERPFATPHRAQKEARKASGTVQVIVHDGIYELNRPLVFTPPDNGQRWSAAPGAAPVLSGGRRLTGWKVGTKNGVPAWTLKLPEVCDRSWYFTQLWVNGQRRERPRLPRTGFFRFTELDGLLDSWDNWLKGPDRAEYPEGSLRRFRNLDDVGLVTYQLWFDTHHRIKKLDEKRRVVHFHAKSLGSLRDEGGQFARFFLKNVGEALAEPGEWYLDRKAGSLTYLPLAGETPESVTVVAPKLNEIIRFQGSKTEAVAGVVIENIGLEHNEWQRPKENPGTIQAAFDVPGAIVFERAEHCVLYGCQVAHIAGYGVEMLAGSHGNVVAASTIRDLGAGAIKVGHEDLVVHGEEVGKDFATEKRWLRPMAATVADCHLYDGGHIYPSAVGVWIGNSGQNRIQHNEIHHFAYTGISFGWNWFWKLNRTWDNRIEWNHIHHINHNRVLSDNGGIYSLGVQPGSTVIGNHIHDIACYHYGGWGIYPDQGSSNILYKDNLVNRVLSSGFAVNCARFLAVQNNIFADMQKDILTPGRRDSGRGQSFERNLVWFDRDNLKADVDWHPLLSATRDNLVWNAGVGGVRWHKGSLEKEQAAGRWLDSIEADPLFADPLGGDFTLRADSPAFALGFRPFDWRKAGVRPRLRLPATWEAYRVPAAPEKALAVAHLSAGKLKKIRNSFEVPVEVALWNPSAKRVRGTWTLRTDEAPAIQVSPGPRVVADLAPGARAVRRLTVRIPSTQGNVWLIAKGDEKTSFSGGLEVAIPQMVSIPRLPASTGSDFKEGLVLDINATGVPILTGRAAIIGDALALDITVREKIIRVDRLTPWTGSSVEVFVGGEPDPDFKGHPRPNQFVIVPPGPQGPAEILSYIRSYRGGPLPSQEWDVVPVDGGWRARVRLPFSAMGIHPDAKSFRFDLICNVDSPVAGQNRLNIAKWGTVANNLNDLLGLAQVDIV